jgi:hypothetical protein
MYKLLFAIFFTFTNSYVAIAKDAYDPDFLAVKKIFADMEKTALAENFVGVRSSQGIQTDLFKIEKTGIDTSHIVSAANNYLNTLSMAEKIQTQFAVQDSEWRKWFNVDNGIYVRQGLSLKEMNQQQRIAAFNMLITSLSAQGLKLSQDIMKTDKTLSEINNNAQHLDEELYFITIMGIPSKTEPWGWQLDGHHLVINYFILGDQVVMTPTFLGAEPAVTTSGKYKGNKVLQLEQDYGLSFITSLSAKQKSQAILKTSKTTDNMLADAHKDNIVLDYAGIPASELETKQKDALIDLISLYVNNMQDQHARVKMAEVTTHLDQTWFSWIGGTETNSVFYYRIHSPVLLIEFDHQKPIGTQSLNDPSIPTKDHIHVVIRTPNGNDYGKDLLKQHLLKHKH